jgi:hypothetical protein
MLRDDSIEANGPGPAGALAARPASERLRRDPAHANPLWAERLLAGPLTATLLVIGLVQVATWLPHYLTWPYWADHDVFATAARAWVNGALPYREICLNQFPATLYLFAALGKTMGWGQPWSLYAFDAGLLLVFQTLLLAWSRRRFGTALPGLVGGLCYLSYALELDYSHAAQRDWHGPVILVMGILAVQTWPGRLGRAAAGIASAVAIAFRPQVVLLLPALGLAVWDSADPIDRVTSRCRALFEGLIPAALTLLLAFAPLVAMGVLGDFVEGVRLASYGSNYSRVTPVSFLKAWILQAAAWRWWVVPVAIAILGGSSRSPASRVARVWILALAGVSLYKPLSPVAHSYLEIPLTLVWSVGVASLVSVWLARRDLRADVRLAGALLALGLGSVAIRPDLCAIGPALRAVQAWVKGTRLDECPPGYKRSSVPTSMAYPWEDYRATLDYVRGHTSPQTRVANVLKCDPAVTGMIDRPSAFPAESIAWIRMVRPDDEPKFAAALSSHRDAVVVWIPGEDGPDKLQTLPYLTPVIRRDYRPEARFGKIEVWRRALD